MTLRWLILGLLIPTTPALSQTSVQLNPTTGWAFIQPTNTSADVTTLQTALNGSLPVRMSSTNAAGTPTVWQICQQVTMPVKQVLEGTDTDQDPGSKSWVATTFSKVILTCPNAGSFVSGQAFIATQDNDVVRGITISGLRFNSGVENCINVYNAVTVEIDHVALVNCSQHGVDDFSDGNVMGATEFYSQLLKMHDNLIYGNGGWGLNCHNANAGAHGGGFCSDVIIGPNNDFAINISGQIQMAGGSATTGAIFDNRIEDNAVAHTYGIYVNGAGDIQITGNNFDKTPAVSLNNSNTIIISGNRGNCCLVGLDPTILFSGANSFIQMAGNQFTASGFNIGYQAAAGATVTNSVINEALPAGWGFFDSYSETLLCPLLTVTQSSFVAAALTDGATIAWDACPIGNAGTAGVGTSATLSITGSSHTHALAFPTNVVPGVAFQLTITNTSGDTGFSTAAGYHYSGGVAPTWSTASGAVDLLTCAPISTSSAICTAVINAH